MALGPVDRWTLGYLAVAAAAVALHGGLARPQGWLVLAGYAALAVVAASAPRWRTGGGAAAFFGTFYPLLAVGGLYTAIGIVHAWTGRSQDAVVQSWEQALFGGQPARAWIRAQPWPALSWPLHLGYLSYYFILAAAPLALWWSGRRAAAARVVLVTAVTFYVCYTIFLVFPVAGPRYLFPPADNAATAVGAARFARGLLERGAAWGTAFPSSHVAAALVASVSAGRRWPALGAVLVPAALLLAAGTVYGQFHYAVDAVAGAALAAVVLAWDVRRPE
jgi:membrane-associated phospholipid phosphatase